MHRWTNKYNKQNRWIDVPALAVRQTNGEIDRNTSSERAGDTVGHQHIGRWKHFQSLTITPIKLHKLHQPQVQWQMAVTHCFLFWTASNKVKTQPHTLTSSVPSHMLVVHAFFHVYVVCNIHVAKHVYYKLTGLTMHVTEHVTWYRGGLGTNTFAATTTNDNPTNLGRKYWWLLTISLTWTSLTLG